MRKYLPDIDYFIGKQVPGQSGEYIIEEHRGSGDNAHVFRAYSEELKHNIAVKIIPKQNIKSSNWKQEFQQANMLSPQVAVSFRGVDNWIDSENDIDCVVLISDYINGPNLKEYIRENKNNISVNFIIDFLKAIFSLFAEMDERPFQHGDLHSGNILVEDQSSLLMGPDYAFKVTDFGTTSVSGNVTEKDDFEQLAFILKNLLENVDYQGSLPVDQFTFNILNDHFLARHLVETDPTRDPYARRPQKLFERINEIDTEFAKSQRQKAVKTLTDPFEFLSCEQIGDSHSLLKSLYSERFLGLSNIGTRDNLILTGPRGCGKSTVFRSLSLQHRLIIGKDNPEDLKYIGIYYRCDDLYFTFPRYRASELQEAVNIPLHFVTSTLLSELLYSIKEWALKFYEKQFIKKEEKASKTIWEILDLSRSHEPGIDSFKALSARLQKERIRAAKKQRFVNDPKHSFGYYFGPDILFKVCDNLIEMLPFLEERPVFFFIDDYSSPKITSELQQNLNRLFMQRTSSCFFKLSTESPVSYSRSDIDTKVYVEGREFSLMNLGAIYIHADQKEKLKFIEDIFDRRLNAIENYPVSDLNALLSNYSGPTYNEVARKIRSGARIEIWGKESLCQLCSGDIHYIIDLVKQMVNRVGGSEGLSKIETFPKISPKHQTASIREQSGNFLKGLRILPNGPHLVEVVSAFGIVANSYLKLRNSKNLKTNPPWQSHRIEPYEQLEISKEAQEIYDELLRYSVFIEDVRGKSRRGKVVPRLFLRRLLIPHFNLTFSMRDPIELESYEIQDLLLAPKDFAKNHRLRKGLITNLDQPMLPGFEMEEK
jgi:serine/threonine protein kinase